MLFEIPTQPGQLQVKEFLRLCLNSRRYPPDLDEAMHHSSQIDWGAFLTYASENLVTPMLYLTLKGSQLIPAELEETLHQEYLRTAKHNLRQAAALKKLVREYSLDHIETMLIKGLALAIPVYGDLTARQSRDIDLLLRA